jgi:hypothetical protein
LAALLFQLAYHSFGLGVILFQAIASPVNIKIKAVGYIFMGEFLHFDVVFERFAYVLLEEVGGVLQHLMVGRDAYLNLKSRTISCLKSTDVGDDVVDSQIELGIFLETRVV